LFRIELTILIAKETTKILLSFWEKLSNRDMGRLFLITIEAEGEGVIYVCSKCNNHITHSHHIVPPPDISFPGNGQGRLAFSKVVNIFTDGIIEVDSTGVFEFEQMYCVGCGELIGWKIVQGVGGLDLTKQLDKNDEV
ncbi:hypothetical protein F8388_022548, partial [Cannabis sativa]